jgi:hypothetical protein
MDFNGLGGPPEVFTLKPLCGVGQGIPQVPSEAVLGNDSGKFLGRRGLCLNRDSVNGAEEAMPRPQAARQHLQGIAQLAVKLCPAPTRQYLYDDHRSKWASQNKEDASKDSCKKEANHPQGHRDAKDEQIEVRPAHLDPSLF